MTNPLDYFQAESEGKTLQGLGKRLYETRVVLESVSVKITDAIKKCPDGNNTRDLIKASAILRVVEGRLKNDELALLKAMTPSSDGTQPEAA